MIYWSIFILILFLFIFIYFVFPLSHDDWWYLGQSLYWSNDSDGHHNLFDGLKSSFMGHALQDNMRLGNTLGVFSVAIPRFYVSLIASFCISLSFFILTKLSNIQTGDYVKLIFMSFFFVFGNLWEDHLFTNMYIFNYIVILPVFLCTIYLFINKDNVKTWSAILMGFFLGAWHEAYAAAMLCSGIAILFLKPDLREKWKFILLFSVIIGLSWNFIFPGLIKRAGTIAGFDLAGFNYILYDWICIFTIIVIVLSTLLNRSNEVLLKPLNICALSSTIVLLFIVFWAHNERAVIPAIFLCVPAVTDLFAKCNWRRNFSVIIAGALFLITSIHLISVCYDAVRMNRSVNSLLNGVVNRNIDEFTVYYDVLYPWDYNKISLFRPDMNLLAPYMGGIPYYLSFYINNDSLYYVPEELKDFSPKGNDLEIWRGHIVSKDIDDINIENISVDYKYYNERRPVYTAKFRGADGLEYVYILPRRSKIGRFMGDPVKVSR